MIDPKKLNKKDSELLESFWLWIAQGSENLHDQTSSMFGPHRKDMSVEYTVHANQILRFSWTMYIDLTNVFVMSLAISMEEQELKDVMTETSNMLGSMACIARDIDKGGINPVNARFGKIVEFLQSKIKADIETVNVHFGKEFGEA